MKSVVALACLLAIMVAAPVHGLPTAPPTPACMGPPCGYITPLIDIDVPTKPKCSAAQSDLSKCMKLPDEGASIKLEGTIRWYWKLSEDLTYPQTDPNAPIVLSFSPSASNPKFLTFKVEPPTFTIDAVATLNPQNMKVDQSTGNPIVYYWFERPITITITRHGEPTATELASVMDHNNVASMLVKAKSTASGAYFKESFGVESFGFNAESLAQSTLGTAPSHASPAWGLSAPIVALAAVALRRRK